MIQKVIQVGDSLAVIIPKSFVKELHITAQSMVKVEPRIKEQKIIFTFLREKDSTH